MKTQNSGKDRKGRRLPRTYMFLAVVIIVYGILFIVMPAKASETLKNSGIIFSNMLLPLVLVFSLMVILNLFIKPAQVARLLGKGARIRGIVLSIVAGIISMGPVYIWFPLLRELREKGAGNLPITVFLYNRAVKPFLLPLMIGYFGWMYVLILTIMTILNSIVLGYLMGIIIKEK